MTSILGATFGERLSLQSGSDFHQHSAKASRRAAKIKKDLGIQVKNTKDYGEHDKVEEIDDESYDKDERYGLVLLYLAERDFSKALEVMVETEMKSSRSKEKFIISKLKRTLQHIKHYIDISFREKSNSKKLELYVFYGISQGLLAVKQLKWSLAAFSFSVTRVTLELLEIYSEYSENKSSHLYREIIETKVEPFLKMALNHSSSLISDLDVSSRAIISKPSPDVIYEDLIELINSIDGSFMSFDESKSSTKLITEVTWCAYTAKLYNTDIARQIMVIERNSKKIIDEDIASFDPILLGWQETLETHEADTERATARGVDDDDEMRDRSIVSTFIKYNLNFVIIRRDIALIKSLIAKKTSSIFLVDINRDIARIYDMIYKTTEDLKDLPGVYSDQDLSNDLDTVQTYFQSLKFQVIANVFGISKKNKESLYILNYVHERLSNVKPLSTGYIPEVVLNNELLKKFFEEIKTEKVKVHVLAQFDHENSQNQSTIFAVADGVNIPVSIQTTSELRKAGKVFDLKNVKPISLKPVFFDLAFNYIGLDKETARLKIEEAERTMEEVEVEETNSEIATESQNKQKKKGLFGLWG